MLERLPNDEDLVRHVVLDNLRSYVKKFKQSYGDLVICCDSKAYWRRDVFPYYKSHRKKDRDKSAHDWPAIFNIMNTLKDELKTYFPYKVVEVYGAEADDVIAVLAKEYSQNEKVLILSSDKDFAQLQKFKNVEQYSPILKRFIRVENPNTFLKEQILRGDRSDGVPNFLSNDSTFVNGQRQRTISKKKLMEWIVLDPKAFCIDDVMKRGYSRNRKIIDFEYIPENIKEGILETYTATKKSSRMEMLNFLMSKKLKKLIEVADEF